MSTLAVSRVASGPLEQKLEQLFREHYQMLYRTAYSLLDNPADAEDVPQTLFLRLLRTGLPPEFSKNPKGYLYRATVNLSLNVLRSRKRQALTDGVERLEIPVEADDSNTAEELYLRLTEAIAELDPESAHVLILRYGHNHREADIARILGLSRGTVAMRLFRARARLKKLMRNP